MSDDRIPMTREGYDKLRAELDRMQNVEMAEITRRIAAARELGDLSENAEYHAARESQGLLQARIDALKHKLSRAVIVDKRDMPADEVAFGAKVRVYDLDLQEEEVLHLVGPGEEDYKSNKILSTSPLAQGLMGKKVGEIAEIQVPRGTLRLEIREISYD
jgi:transcription elongation factor GreA